VGGWEEEPFRQRFDRLVPEEVVGAGTPLRGDRLVDDGLVVAISLFSLIF